MVARIPSVVKSVVPECVVSTCVYTSVARCVLQRTHRTSERRCVRGATSVRATPCLDETPSAAPCASEPPCTNESPCVGEAPNASEPPCASGVVTSVPECVLPGTPCVKGAPQAKEAACAAEAARVCRQPACMRDTPRVSAPVGVSSVVCVSEARVSERPCVGCVRTACVRSLYTREMSVAMYEHAAASPGVSVNGNAIVCGLSLATRGSVSARVAWRRKLRLWRAKCRVAAVVVIGTVPGLHGSARVVRSVPRARPPRARSRW